jgi:hypothetical protein
MYRAADLFLSPVDCLTESFGLTLIEAMACGTPQLAADWNGYRDIVSNGDTGFLVPSSWDDPFNMAGIWDILDDRLAHLWNSHQVALDYRLLEHYLCTMLQNSDLLHSMRQCSRLRALSLYSYRSIGAEYRALANELRSIAQKAPIKARRSMPQRSQYFDHFGHYSSAQNGEEQLVLAGSTFGPYEMLANYFDGSLLFLVNRDLHSAVIETVSAAKSDLTLNELACRIASTKRWASHYIWWYCRMLVKFDCLRLETAGSLSNGALRGNTCSSLSVSD